MLLWSYLLVVSKCKVSHAHLTQCWSSCVAYCMEFILLRWEAPVLHQWSWSCQLWLCLLLPNAQIKLKTNSCLVGSVATSLSLSNRLWSMNKEFKPHKDILLFHFLMRNKLWMLTALNNAILNQCIQWFQMAFPVLERVERSKKRWLQPSNLSLIKLMNHMPLIMNFQNSRFFHFYFIFIFILYRLKNGSIEPQAFN